MNKAQTDSFYLPSSSPDWLNCCNDWPDCQFWKRQKTWVMYMPWLWHWMMLRSQVKKKTLLYPCLWVETFNVAPPGTHLLNYVRIWIFRCDNWEKNYCSIRCWWGGKHALNVWPQAAMQKQLSSAWRLWQNTTSWPTDTTFYLCMFIQLNCRFMHYSHMCSFKQMWLTGVCTGHCCGYNKFSFVLFGHSTFEGLMGKWQTGGQLDKAIWVHTKTLSFSNPQCFSLEMPFHNK